MEKNSPSTHPKKRRRTKNLTKKIKDQVEFFFSDANLCRDKYLLEKTGPVGTKYVSIDLLLEFNSIKELGATPYLIAKAIKESNWLQLDEGEKHVRRRVGIGTSVKNDQCTIYIEGLPCDATISWMRQVCAKLGKAKHIYLPKFKNSDVLKGFAFVEFEHKEEAYRACNILNSPPPNFFPNRTSSYLSSLVVRNHAANSFQDKKKNGGKSDEKDGSCNTYQRQNTSLPPLQRVNNSCCQKTCYGESGDANLKELCILRNEHADDNTAKVSNFEHSTVENSAMPNHTSNCSKTTLPNVVIKNNRKRCMSEPSNDHTKPKLKKLNESRTTFQSNHIPSNNHMVPDKELSTKGSTEQCVDSKLLDVHTAITYGRFLANKAIKQKETKIRHCSSSPDFAALPQVQPAVLSSVVMVPKGGKRSSRKTRRKKNKTLNQLKTHQSPPNIKAMPKIAWLEIKKNYQHKQREEMGKIKSILQHNSLTDRNTQSTFIKRHLALEEHVSIEEMSSSNDVVDTSSLAGATESSGKRSETTFQAGVIVEVQNYKLDSSQSLSANIKLLKQHFSLFGPVAYVDIQQNMTCYIRFGNANYAQQAVLEEQDYNLCLLTGVVEEAYWDNLLASRQIKRSRERPKVRGREKIAMKAIQLTCQNSKQHIKFNHNY